MEDFNKIPHFIHESKKLGMMRVVVGGFSVEGRKESYNEMILRTLEGGKVIRPVHAKFLAIPTKLGYGKKPSEVPGLFRPKGKNILCTSVGGELQVYYILKDHVVIPPRPFLRDPFNLYAGTKWQNLVDKGLKRLLDDEKFTARELYVELGRQMVRDVKKAFITMMPRDAPITAERKGNDQPLIDTGTLLHSIDWRIEDV